MRPDIEEGAGQGATVFVCRECPGGADRLERVRRALSGTGCDTRPSSCLSGCRSGASVAIRAPGRMAWLLGPVTEDDMAHLPEFMRLYHAAPQGAITDARSLGTLRLRVLARIPALS